MNEPDRHQEWSDNELLAEHESHPERFQTTPFMKTENPKEFCGRLKTPMHLLSPSAMRETANVLGHGAAKYQPRNYREAGINASTYHAAMMRHLLAWADGEDLDPESGLSHIAHVAACADIVLDSLACGMMNDDRSKKPTPEQAAERMTRSVLHEVTPGKPIPVVGELKLESISGLPPLPPVPHGFSRWAYRGIGWASDSNTPKAFFYEATMARWSDITIGTLIGMPDYHYIEAVK